jgi:hypothetical protein
MTLSQKAQEILSNLRIEAESIETRADGSTWGQVYLDNARPSGMSAHGFAGYLQALHAAGLYRTLDGIAFGLVRL